ncbi:MAG: 4-(cytidine 5'-diphospho)-2-C-methyl-D-erythritol kinase [Planctomycetota bacterium]
MEPRPSVAAIDAPAKINLYLDILGRRDDGYHEIDTVMQTVDLADRLELRARADGEIRLTVTGRTEGVPADDRNLVMKAARALAEEVRAGPAPDNVPGADIVLHKRIPTGAGLGGGSSDAAAALVGLSTLWGIEVAPELLSSLAAGLGSDVPFFVLGGTARCRGRGEIVEASNAKGELHAVLAISAPLATREVYEAFDRLGPSSPAAPKPPPVSAETAFDLGRAGEVELPNALEPAAFELRADLRAVKDELVRAGAHRAALSGSGSCVFGVVPSAADARRVAETMRRGGHEALVVRSVGPREPFASGGEGSRRHTA